MKKFFILTILLLGWNGSSLAMSTVNFKQANLYSCNSMKLDQNMTESWIRTNCKNVKIKTDNDVANGAHYNNTQKGDSNNSINNGKEQLTRLDKLSFYTDEGVFMNCYYKNYKLLKCKYKR